MAHRSLGFMQLTIIIGFSSYFAWYMIVFFGMFAFPLANLGFAALHTGQVLFFAAGVAATACFLAVFHRTDSVRLGHTRFLYLASIIPGSALPAFILLDAAGLSGPAPAFYGACLLSGASVSVGFMLWEDLSLHGYLNKGVLAHGTVFCAGAAVFMVCTSLLTTFAATAVCELLLCASTALLAFITPRCDTLEDKAAAPARFYFRSTWHLDVLVAVINVAFGYAFILLYQMGPQALLAAMCIAASAGLAVSVALSRGRWLLFVGSLRVFSAVAACALILLVCLDGALRVVALGVLVVAWFSFRIINGGSLSDLAMRRSFSMLYTSTRGKISTNVGFTAGLAMGVAASAGAGAQITYLYAPLALVAAFILAALFLLPFENESSTAGYKTLAFVEMHEASGAHDAKTCRELSKRYKLSPRESEVLVYVVRGRNAKHVAEKLFISESTAKTHISNIYRKTGVHSQQELLDKIDWL